MKWFSYKGETGDAQSIPEPELPGKKRDRECVMVAEILSQFDVT